MSQHEIASRIENLVAFTVSAIIIGALLIHAQHRDEQDNHAARQCAAKQVHEAAQPDTWAKLDRDARRMTAYDKIK